MKKIYLLGFLTLLFLNTSKAQDSSIPEVPFESLMGFNWEFRYPLGHKYVEDASFTGGKIEYRKMLENNISVGINLSWNSYYEHKEYQTFHLENDVDVTTDLYKYNYTMPMALTLHKYFSTSGGAFFPYVGIGLGALYSEPSLFFNIYVIDETNWGFLVRPEIGGILKLGQEGMWGIHVAVDYEYSTNSESFFHIDNLQSWGGQVGIAILY